GEVLVKPCLKFNIPIEYHLSGKLQNMFLSEGFIIANTVYTHEVTYTVYSPKEKKELLEHKIREITGGVLRMEDAGTENIYVDDKGNILEAKK
ncbi:MAG: DUF1949 domain-containing protein, partial [Acetivibrionales bacterium]